MLNTLRNEINESLACVHGKILCKNEFVIVLTNNFSMKGIPGVKESLLEEFGIRLVTYDLPGFGESDPHPKRNSTPRLWTWNTWQMLLE